MRDRLLRPGVVGLTGVGAAALAMAADHLMGDDPGLEDPPAFLVAVALSLTAAFIVFAFVLPRTSPERAGRRGLVTSLLAVLSLPLAFLGFFFVLAAGGIALGRLGRGRGAAAAVAIGAVVAVVGLIGYAYVAVGKL